MIFILLREREEGERVYRLSKMSAGESGENSILAMEIHVISTSTSIAFDIFFIQ